MVALVASARPQPKLRASARPTSVPTHLFESGVGDEVSAYLDSFPSHALCLLSAEEEQALSAAYWAGQAALAQIRDTSVDRSTRECIELGKRFEAGQAARTKLIEANVRLVVWLAKWYVNEELPLADLISEGNIGLIRAADRFKPEEHGYCRFSSYATWWIRQAISRAVMEKCHMIYLPHQVQHNLKKIKQAKERFEAQYGVAPQMDDLVPCVQELLPKAKVTAEWIYFHLHLPEASISLSGLVGDEQEDELQTILASDSNVEEDVTNHHRAQVLYRFLRRLLSKREFEVVVGIWGLFGEAKQTLDQLHVKFQVTRERIRQISEGALKKLRAAISEHPQLKALLDL